MTIGRIGMTLITSAVGGAASAVGARVVDRALRKRQQNPDQKLPAHEITALKRKLLR